MMKIHGSMLALPLIASACLANDLVGTIFQPLPDGWQEQGSTCIAASLGIEKVCAYS
jgi:hypothetical protein